jgi:hypothetical protein
MSSAERSWSIGDGYRQGGSGEKNQGRQRSALALIACRGARFRRKDIDNMLAQHRAVDFGSLPNLGPIDPEICMHQNVPESDDGGHGTCGYRLLRPLDIAAAASPTIDNFCTTALRINSDFRNASKSDPARKAPMWSTASMMSLR